MRNWAEIWRRKGLQNRGKDRGRSFASTLYTSWPADQLPNLLIRILVFKQQPYRGWLLHHQLCQPLVQVPLQLSCITVAQQVSSCGQHAAVVIHLLMCDELCDVCVCDACE